MILRFLFISLCFLAPLRAVQAGNYYKSFAHSVLESLPDSVKKRLNPVFSQVVLECAQFETDRYVHPELADCHFDFGEPTTDSLLISGRLVNSLLANFDSLCFYFSSGNQKKLIWFTARVIHFSSELAIPHRIHRGYLDKRVFSQVSLREDENLVSRNSLFNFSVIPAPTDLNLKPQKKLSDALVKNRQISSDILGSYSSSELKKESYSPDGHHKKGGDGLLSLYGNQYGKFMQLVTEAQSVAVFLLITASNCNQTMENSHKK